MKGESTLHQMPGAGDRTPLIFIKKKLNKGESQRVLTHEGSSISNSFFSFLQEGEKLLWQQRRRGGSKCKRMTLKLGENNEPAPMKKRRRDRGGVSNIHHSFFMTKASGLASLDPPPISR